MRLLPAPISSVIKAKSRSWYDGAISWRREPAGDFNPFIVTGPPRSGTSLMNALLGRKRNVIVVNEPLEMMPRLFLTGRSTRKLQGYLHRTARLALTQGVVVNKVDPENPHKPTSDTFNKGAQWRPIPVDIDRGNRLCVAAKATMPFMDCLEELCSAWPALRMIIMIRDPGATLRSWKQTFGWQPGLDRADAGFQFGIYDRVDRGGDALERRARLWRVLVEESLAVAGRYGSQVLIVRYEDLVANPGVIMARAFAHIGAVSADDPIDVSDVVPQDRSKYVGFTDSEVAKIERECAPAVEELDSRHPLGRS